MVRGPSQSVVVLQQGARHLPNRAGTRTAACATLQLTSVETFMGPNDRSSSSSDRRGGFAGGAFVDMQREMNRLFDDVVRSFRGSAPIIRSRTSPRLDVHESDSELCVVADIPGVQPSDVDVRLDGLTLVISAERRADTETKQENYHLMERSRGVLRRSVQLPFAPDPEQVRANYENGVLTVRMPKRASQGQGHRIQVQGSATSRSASSNIPSE